MKNKETLEEAGEIFVNNRFTKQICGDESYPDIYASKAAIVESHILFAKCQAKRSYSEEEVLDIIHKCGKYCYDSKKIGTDIGLMPILLIGFFEQFKKK